MKSRFALCRLILFSINMQFYYCSHSCILVFLQKADKIDLENCVNRQRFETDITRIDDALKELIDQVKSSVS